MNPTRLATVRRLLGDDQCHHAADERGWQGVENLQHDSHRWKQNQQHDEHADHRNAGQNDDELRCPLLALKLSAVLDEVADRHLHLIADTLLDVADRTGQVAAFGVAANHDSPSSVLAIDRVRARAFADVRDFAKFDLAAFGFAFAMQASRCEVARDWRSPCDTLLPIAPANRSAVGLRAPARRLRLAGPSARRRQRTRVSSRRTPNRPLATRCAAPTFRESARRSAA